jgi:hypothetical protein
VIPAVINLQDGCHVPTSVTIIRSTEYGHDLLFLQMYGTFLSFK